MIDVEATREYFKGDRFCLQNGIIIDSITEESAVCTVEIKDHHLNALDTVQGGLIFTLADFTFAVHAIASGKKTVLRSADITYIKPARGTKLIGKAIPISAGRNTCLYRAEIFDDRDVLIAYAVLNGYILESKPGK
ncbi:MAG: PaaI family thioesterase [Christensenellaceae bacterium]|jgi:acyl-CoA thioesterase|nr:PaaI family thioesterase [Christensenellaceae bacterium]